MIPQVAAEVSRPINSTKIQTDESDQDSDFASEFEDFPDQEGFQAKASEVEFGEAAGPDDMTQVLHAGGPLEQEGTAAVESSNLPIPNGVEEGPLDGFLPVPGDEGASGPLVREVRNTVLPIVATISAAHSAIAEKMSDKSLGVSNPITRDGPVVSAGPQETNLQSDITTEADGSIPRALGSKGSLAVGIEHRVHHNIDRDKDARETIGLEARVDRSKVDRGSSDMMQGSSIAQSIGHPFDAVEAQGVQPNEELSANGIGFRASESSGVKNSEIGQIARNLRGETGQLFSTIPAMVSFSTAFNQGEGLRTNEISGPVAEIGSFSEPRAVPLERVISLQQTLPHSPAALAHQVKEIAVQIAASANAGRMELLLVPEDLGRVRLTLTPIEAGHSVLVDIERPEVLDAVRRHLDVLSTAFEDAGFSNLSFNFHDKNQSDEGEDVEANTAETTIHEGVRAGQVLQILPSGRLDLKL